MCPETTVTRCPAGPDQGGPRCATCFRTPPIPGARDGRMKAEPVVRHVSSNHLCPVPRRAGRKWTMECDMYTEATLTRCLPRAGPRWTTECECRAPSSGTKFVEHILFPSVPEFVPEHSLREQKCSRQCSGTLGFCVFLRFREHFCSRTVASCSRFCSRQLAPGTKNVPDCRCPPGRIKVDHGVRDVPGNPLLPMPHRAGSRRTTDCDMYLARTLTPLPRRAGARCTTECEITPGTTVSRCPIGPE